MNFMDFSRLFAGIILRHFIPTGPQCFIVIAGPAEDPHSRVKLERARKEQQHQHSFKVCTVTRICTAEIRTNTKRDSWF